MIRCGRCGDGDLKVLEAAGVDREDCTVAVGLGLDIGLNVAVCAYYGRTCGYGLIQHKAHAVRYLYAFGCGGYLDLAFRDLAVGCQVVGA